MKKINKIAIFFIIISTISQDKILRASDTSSLNAHDFEQNVKFSKSIEDILQKFKIGQYVSDITTDRKSVYLEELKQINSTITSDHDLFDSWITFILKNFSKDYDFDNSLRLAIEKGERETATLEAQNNLGLIYCFGRGVAQSDETAVQWFQKAADQGYALAQYNFGSMYQKGKGVTENLSTAIEWYKKSTNQGNADAQYALGWIEISSIKDSDEKTENDCLKRAAQWFKKAANQGHVNAQHYLALQYQFERGVKLNVEKTFKWQKKAAKQGHPLAQYELGDIYLEGQGVGRDYAQALKWYTRAAEQGNAEAQCKLGDIYLERQGVDRDYTQALKWYLKAFKNKSIQTNLKNLIKNLVDFIPSTIFSEDDMNFPLDQKIVKKNNYETELKNTQTTIKDNIEIFIGLHEIEKGSNRPESTFKESQYAIPSLFQPYEEIIDFEAALLKIMHAYDQPGFMVTCLKPKDVEAFKSSNCPDIKYYELQDQSYLTFGKSNIEAADQLMRILSDKDKVQPYHTVISKMLRIEIKVQESYQVESLILQRKIRSNLASEDQRSEMIVELNTQNKLIEDAERQIDSLTELQKMPQYLKDLLIEGIPYRNKQFLQKEDYIESIFAQ